MAPAIQAAERIRFLEDRLGVLSGALREFAEATTDYERLLDVVARTLAAVVKDGCVVRLVARDGWLNAAAIHLPVERAVLDEALVVRVREHVARPHHLAEHPGARRVIETGEPLLIAHLDPKQLQAAPEIVQAYQALGIHSALLVALRVRGESIGLLSLVRFAPGSPPFDQEDLKLAQAIADHAALAISNARLLRQALADLTVHQQTEHTLRQTEAQLRHSQKLEAVGRLAGGVAHDFNNVLSVILTYSESLADDPAIVGPLRDDVEEIRLAGERAAELTRQLLAFSRQQVLDPHVLNLNQALGGIEKMLRRLLGADVELVTVTAEEPWSLRADSGQLGQVLMNLALNARDAMPSGGKLTITTANVVGDREHPGDWVQLSVRDDGCGMDPQTQAHLFEPFFTTKGPGKGTGLGLSTVFGIVTQSGGRIEVESEVDRGTTFKVSFPRVQGPEQAPRPELLAPPSLRGTETVLLVEDDEQVRALARGILRRNGYQVLEAANAGEALLISEQHPEKIHLLLTDVVLPRMSGRQLAERLAPARPEMKWLFTSGYTDDAVLQHGVLGSGPAYLQKPITPGSLTRKVREVLG